MVETGSPEPLGVTLESGGANVAVFSAHADAIELCLFDESGERETARVALPARSGDVFHGFVPGLTAGTRYGLRALGSYDPKGAHRFNAAKLLVDPYAKALDRPFMLDAAMRGERPDGSRDDADSARVVPKCIVTAPYPASTSARPRIPWTDTIVYELHVRGFTQQHPGIPSAIRGTFAGLAHPAAIAHLLALGVTTVEVMPIAASIDERHLPPLGLRNYWGYNPVALFVPDRRLAPGGIDEFAACVAALHAAGLEVVVDVVLNHSGEGNELGPTLCLRGLDNATYYRTRDDDRARYVDDAGTGNTLALDRPPVLRLALDALRYYADVANVDGYRFDLATTLGRVAGGFDAAAPLFRAIATDPTLSQLKLIAEPWDVGANGYRLGRFPDAWREWNDRYRDTARRFWRGDADCRGELATRLAGSSDVFAARNRPPSSSINFVTAHDGFTLLDLVSFACKHNEGNGEGNRDGTDTNYSWNHGVEGPSTDAAINAARARDVRALLATLLVSRGTPMLAMGDESGRTQQGNNNAYAQDGPLTWLDWEAADHQLVAFVAALIALRKRHPALRLDRWLTGGGVDASGIPDVSWRQPEGAALDASAWNDREAPALVAMFYAPASANDGADRVGIGFNAGEHAVSLRWPAPRAGFHWQLAIDTSVALPAAGIEGASAPDKLPARSVVVVVEAPNARARSRAVDAVDRLAEAAGIAPEWSDISGQRHVVSADTKRSLLRAMALGVDNDADARARLAELADACERRRLPAAVVAGAGAPLEIPIAVGDATSLDRLALRLVHEDGREVAIDTDIAALPVRTIAGVDGRSVRRLALTLPALPAGCHTLTLEDYAGAPCRIIAAPERCYLPEPLRAGARRYGLAAHLYALRRAGDQGIGDFTTLAEIGVATARAGGAIVAINPLHALFGTQRERASPYHPSDRRFIDPIYIDLRWVPELANSRKGRALLEASAAAIARLAAAAEVDYEGVWHAKRTVLEACFATFERRRDDPRHAEFERFVAAGGAALQRFATFEAIAAFHPRLPWRRWPAGLSHPEARGVAAFARHNRARIRFAIYLQWLAAEQLAGAAAHAAAGGLEIGFHRDLAIGAAPDGAEAWANPDLFAQGASTGAPPDPFSRAGQVWGLPPPIPRALASGGYESFRALLGANMRHAGGLRIDHVMGLTRLFWIPEGASALDGAYVRYPIDDLLGVLALESHRARCLVVGEDLGTVPAGFRERMAAADVLSYRVVWFESDGASYRASARYPALAATCVSTHDLPTITGWWQGADLDERRALGHLGNDALERERRERAEAKAGLAAAIAASGCASVPIDPACPHDADLTAAIHRFACATPSALVLFQADDFAGESVALNLPGTDRERPNWRRKLGIDVASLWDTPTACATREGCAQRAAPQRQQSGSKP
jgi:glycogen debranching enzyme GlgX/4-alpha-glucanotransferase